MRTLRLPTAGLGTFARFILVTAFLAGLGATTGAIAQVRGPDITLTGSNARSIALNPATNKIYALHNNNPGSVTEIDGATHAIRYAVQVPVGWNPVKR